MAQRSSSWRIWLAVAALLHLGAMFAYDLHRPLSVSTALITAGIELLLLGLMLGVGAVLFRPGAAGRPTTALLPPVLVLALFGWWTQDDLLDLVYGGQHDRMVYSEAQELSRALNPLRWGALLALTLSLSLWAKGRAGPISRVWLSVALLGHLAEGLFGGLVALSALQAVWEERWLVYPQVLPSIVLFLGALLAVVALARALVTLWSRRAELRQTVQARPIVVSLELAALVVPLGFVISAGLPRAALQHQKTSFVRYADADPAGELRVTAPQGLGASEAEPELLLACEAIPGGWRCEPTNDPKARLPLTMPLGALSEVAEHAWILYAVACAPGDDLELWPVSALLSPASMRCHALWLHVTPKAPRVERWPFWEAVNVERPQDTTVGALLESLRGVKPGALVNVWAR
ncbi:hypothetical protein L6R46_20805 [Myxococcota bacterium]|nr:hypothetical protein [Myxococcota bacterium]